MNRRAFFRSLPLIPAALVAIPRTASAMNLAKAQAVGAAVTNAGFSADLNIQADGSWKVRAISPNIDIPIASAQSLAVTNGVVGNAAMIEFV